MQKFLKSLTRLFVVFMLLAILVMVIPSLRNRATSQLQQWWVKIDYFFNPPEEAIFTPATQAVTDLSATLQAMTQQVPTLTITPTQNIQTPTLTPTLTPTPLPEKVELTGIIYQTQKGFWNYCAPANLYMNLTYWGWRGDIHDIGKFVKPYDEDKNVMTYELASYVEEKTDYSIVTRYGGTLEIIKRLLAAGFPVLIEKGNYARDTTGKISWMGHYNVINGYDEARRVFIVQDSLFTADYEIDYDLLQTEWRGFNYVFQVVYPEDYHDQVLSVLGEYADETASIQIAAQIASDEAFQLNGNDQFHAWFNRGTSLQLLQDYTGSAAAYDQAFLLLPTLEKDTRPWRIVWYQTGPYYAYYFSGRYQDVIDLATNTIDAATQPYFEESFYWRGLAEAALGDLVTAREDFCTSLKYHPGFTQHSTRCKTWGWRNVHNADSPFRGCTY